MMKRVAAVQTSLLFQFGYSHHGDLELAGIRDGIRRRVGAPGNFRAEVGCGISRRVIPCPLAAYWSPNCCLKEEARYEDPLHAGSCWV